MSRLSLGASTALPAAAVGEQSLTVTATRSLDLLPDAGFFIDTLVSLPGVQSGSTSWGDCNQDGVFDMVLLGQVSPTLKIARVYQQQIGGSFALTAVLSDVIDGAAAWGDFDNDGWLDLVLTGEHAGVPVSNLYRNLQNPGSCTFALTAANLIGVRHSSVAWGDYNADGQLDLLLAGDNGSQPVTRLYRNHHGSLIDSGLSLPGIQHGAAVWGDYNTDGLADLLLTGATSDGVPLTQLYRSNGAGALIAVSTTLPALNSSAAAWGDYDNDGDLDLLLEGAKDGSVFVAEVYRNQQGVFVKNDTANNLLGSNNWAGAAWGDFNTDGYPDALLSSNSFATAYPQNEITGTFGSGLTIGSSALTDGSAAWGHYDNDGNLDVVVTGYGLNGQVTKVYRYSALAPSAPPLAPRNLTATVTGGRVALRWSPPVSDDHTPLPGLSYNLRVGTQPGGVDIIAPLALVTTDPLLDGKRQLPAIGNVYQTRAITLSNLSPGQTYYWSVQAIDTSFLGSSFAAEGSFVIPQRVYLPIVLKDYITYYANEWETEPNNTYLQANGPLKSGQIYRGVHNDERDYYSVYLPAGGTLQIDMSSPSGGTQIQLFYQVADVDHRVGFDSSPPYEIDYTGAPGWYYIYVYTNPIYIGSQTYTLTAVYP